jgi:hypothetical protein
MLKPWTHKKVVKHCCKFYIVLPIFGEGGGGGGFFSNALITLVLDNWDFFVKRDAPNPILPPLPKKIKKKERIPFPQKQAKSNYEVMTYRPSSFMVSWYTVVVLVGVGSFWPIALPFATFIGFHLISIQQVY